MSDAIFDRIGCLDGVVYMVLNSLGLSPLPLREINPPVLIDDVTDLNGAAFLSYFRGQPIQAIKAIRDVTGFDLKTAKRAYDSLLETYGEVGGPSNLVSMALEALRDGNAERAITLLLMFELHNEAV